MKKPLSPPAVKFGAAFLKDILREAQPPSPLTAKGEYIHWDKLRHLTPPAGMTVEQQWRRLAFGRRLKQYALPLLDAEQKPFWFCRLDELEKFQHWLDKNAAGVLGGEEPSAFDENRRERFLMGELMDEAIHSSQLEGATTTRIVARRILNREDKKPKNKDERMIVNNYNAMLHIRDMKNEELSAPIILELHRILTDGTLDDGDDAGRVRRRDDIAVVDNLDNHIMHRPPAAKELPSRLQNLCDFANEKTTKHFLHPALRAMILHFMLAFDHPFIDGNGRTARALFYWAMARHGYWLATHASISKFIMKAPRNYYHSFLRTETDGNDLTYFLLHQAEIVRKAFAHLHGYAKRQTVAAQKTSAWEREMLRAGKLNHRQAALLRYAAKHPGHPFSATDHKIRHRVSYPTARADLLSLVSRGVLNQYKIGREYFYETAEDAAEKLSEE